jgi:putative oxidoreductase
MSIFEGSSTAWTGRMLSVLRIMSAFAFLLHGTQKLFDWPIASRAPIELMSQSGLAGVLETFGGALLLLGLFTRPVAFLLSGEMAVAYFQVHFPRGFLPIANGGDNALLFCFLFLYFVFAGAGPWSLDHLIAARGHRANYDGPRTL